MNDSIKECVKAMKLLEEIRQKKFQPVPRGWFTIEQYMENTGCGKTFACQSMKELARAGRVESRKWPFKASDGRTAYTTIYKNK